MGEVSRYPQGAFCWIDLGTTDVAGARSFYEGLFGWEADDVDGYVLWRLGGRIVSGLHEHSYEEGTGWTSNVSVDDVDAAAERARELGAAVVVEPVEIPGTGKVSSIRDPAGAELALWQPLAHAGAQIVNEVGTWSWNELVAADLQAAAMFYGDLFGWGAEAAPGPIARLGFSMGHLLIGGAHEPTPGEDPRPRWTVSFRVADTDESADRAEQLGGRIVLPPMDIPLGRIAIVSDPAEATFTLAAVPGGALRGVDGS
jgi:predicted enzyme related to lactoylglutathione lyase